MPAKKIFDYKLGDTAKAKMTSETGVIIGRAHYLRSEPQYLLQYVAADGRQTDSWFDEDALVIVTSSD